MGVSDCGLILYYAAKFRQYKFTFLSDFLELTWVSWIKLKDRFRIVLTECLFLKKRKKKKENIKEYIFFKKKKRKRKAEKIFSANMAIRKVLQNDFFPALRVYTFKKQT